MKRLPDKKSELLRLAVRDAQLCEADPRYVINMMAWHQLGHSLGDHVANGERCHVCMGGAVMAKTLGFLIDRPSSPGGLDADTKRKLYSIDDMREGIFDDKDIKLNARLKELETYIRDRFDDALARAPWHVYLEVADELERMGL